MTIPDDTRALVEVQSGDALRVCDPRCALTHQEQTGEAVSLRQVTDFSTGEPLAPDQAFYVSGSDFSSHPHDETIRTTPADVAERHWHRCLPSVIAFASRDSAIRFQREHSGVVMALDELGFGVSRIQDAGPTTQPLR